MRKKQWGSLLRCTVRMRTATIFLSALLLMGQVPVGAEKNEAEERNFDCKSAVLMEASTGKLLFEQNPDEALPPASVTKIMTLLLVMEAIEDGSISYEDTVTASAHACSMGGSQIYLKEGERMTVRDLIKSVVIASANDAAVALAEHVDGTEEAFVRRMNQRAQELGMLQTNFENTNGLDDTATRHVTSARDIALMSQALLRHDTITEFSTVWMDTIRDGTFGLTNTNRLIRFYRGATGLKTGSTAKAGFCISATAERDGMELICVIMGAPSRDVRNAAAVSLLDWGFSNFSLFCADGQQGVTCPVRGGVRESCSASYPSFSAVVSKSDLKKVRQNVELPQTLTAPVVGGTQIGKVTYTVDGVEIGSCTVTADEDVAAIGYWGVFWRILQAMSVF